MAEQEVTMYVAPVRDTNGLPNAKRLWEVRYDDSTTELNNIRHYASKGWKLVSVTPIIYAGSTTELLFTFTREKT